MSPTAHAVPRPPGLRRAVVVAACVLLVAAAAAPTSAHAVAPPATQRLALLLGDHVARTGPSVQAHRIGSVAVRRPLTHVHTVLPVLGSRTGHDGSRWLHVALPGRPSGHTGWITAARTRRTATAWSIAVRLSLREVTVWHDGRVARRFRAIVGKPSTPTPRGRFFVEEALRLSASAAGGPYALASSARSSVLQEFDGGPGQIAVHGLDHLGGDLGTAASHGCVRLSTPAITWLAARIGAGVPLTVTA
jgi:lipoprotein-anchoring transpeptidase ErfK/SrfK